MMLLAIQAANSTSELDYEWFEAVCDTEEEAGQLQYKTNADRWLVAFREKRDAAAARRAR